MDNIPNTSPPVDPTVRSLNLVNSRPPGASYLKRSDPSPSAVLPHTTLNNVSNQPLSVSPPATSNNTSNQPPSALPPIMINNVSNHLPPVSPPTTFTNAPKQPMVISSSKNLNNSTIIGSETLPIKKRVRIEVVDDHSSPFRNDLVVNPDNYLMDVQPDDQNVEFPLNPIWTQKINNSRCKDSDFDKFNYNTTFTSKIKGSSISIPKTNFNVRTIWLCCALTTQAPFCHFHSRAVENVFLANSNTIQFHILQASYFPKQKTNIGYRYLPITISDALIDTIVAFKQTRNTFPFHEHIHFYFESESITKAIPEHTNR
eukprot:TRINITY_DN5012_c0_g2_i7.p1 TRINITY_DN5012_c0_g2~~TRINITY_DN5012_c0_g2_i7.p1  ORF type:complete len:315 (-),score=25.53 TRINITY_DN5012_c0_g2_i7:1505-2449(-)